MVMFRDWGVCWLLSIGFEILECTLQFIIPEFKECWWDSLLIDLLGANMLGMAAGWVTLQVRKGACMCVCVCLGVGSCPVGFEILECSLHSRVQGVLVGQLVDRFARRELAGYSG